MTDSTTRTRPSSESWLERRVGSSWKMSTDSRSSSSFAGIVSELVCEDKYSPASTGTVLCASRGAGPIVGQQDESVPSRPLEDLAVGGRAVTDPTPVAGFDARVCQRLDPPRRQVHVDQELQLEPTVTSRSSLRHAA